MSTFASSSFDFVSSYGNGPLVNREVAPIGEYFSTNHTDSFSIEGDSLEEVIPEMILVIVVSATRLNRNKANVALAR